MSRLFRNRLRIALAPDRLLMSGERRGWRRTPDEPATLPVEPGRDYADWRPAIEALPAALALARLERPEVSVVLSNHFVRYALLPPDETLKKDAEWRAYARHRLAAIHGAVSQEWLVRVSAAQPGGIRIVTASDNALVEEVRAKVAASGGTLVSVQPNLVAAFNRVREDIGESACWLVVREAGRLTMAMLEDGTWRALRTRRVDDEAELPLADVLERECALLGLDERCTRSVLYVHEDFALYGRHAQHIEDWRLDDTLDEQDRRGGLRTKAPARTLAPVEPR